MNPAFISHLYKVVTDRGLKRQGKYLVQPFRVARNQQGFSQDSTTQNNIETNTWTKVCTIAQFVESTQSFPIQESIKLTLADIQTTTSFFETYTNEQFYDVYPSTSTISFDNAIVKIGAQESERYRQYQDIDSLSKTNASIRYFAGNIDRRQTVTKIPCIHIFFGNNEDSIYFSALLGYLLDESPDDVWSSVHVMMQSAWDGYFCLDARRILCPLQLILGKENITMVGNSSELIKRYKEMTGYNEENNLKNIPIIVYNGQLDNQFVDFASDRDNKVKIVAVFSNDVANTLTKVLPDRFVSITVGSDAITLIPDSQWLKDMPKIVQHICKNYYNMTQSLKNKGMHPTFYREHILAPGQVTEGQSNKEGETQSTGNQSIELMLATGQITEETISQGSSFMTTNDLELSGSPFDFTFEGGQRPPMTDQELDILLFGAPSNQTL